MYFARLRLGTARFLTGAILLAGVVPAFSQAVLMGVHPVFDGLQPGSGTVPVEVDLANTGESAKGIVRVTAGDYAMTYPIELPQGTKKRLITYPDCGQFASSPLQYDLITNRGHIHQTVETSGGPSTQLVVGEVAQNGGDLGFLKSQSRDYAMMAPQDVYVKPADAPDRPAGYDRLSALVLGEGAERLTDDAVNAIKTWALEGGTLVFIGGASAPILNDPRWSTVLPVHDATQQNFNGSASLKNRYGSSPQPFTAMVGQPVYGAQSRAGGLILERPFGLGRAVYIAFNPFENPMIGWGSRSKLFSELFSPSTIGGAQMVINSVVNVMPNDPYGRYRYRYASGYPGSEPPTANNPFRATLPDTSRVLLILGLYFLAVVPLNFIVLRKLKKGEWAWGTAPVISLAFAGAFFASAKDLYSADMSTSTNGLLIMQQGNQDALVLGHTQMYFPHGGRYDLKLANVDSLIDTTPDQTYGYYGGGPRPQDQHSIYEDLDPVDTGAIQASISVPNLAFREMSYREHTLVNNWFDVHRVADGQFSITNNSDFTLSNARLAGGGGWMLIGDVPPKDTRLVTFKGQLSISSDDTPSRLGTFVIRSGGLALTGRVKGMRAGPLIGSEVKDSAGLILAFVTNEHLKSSEMVRGYQQMEGNYYTP